MKENLEISIAGTKLPKADIFLVSASISDYFPFENLLEMDFLYSKKIELGTEIRIQVEDFSKNFYVQKIENSFPKGSLGISASVIPASHALFNSAIGLEELEITSIDSLVEQISKASGISIRLELKGKFTPLKTKSLLSFPISKTYKCVLDLCSRIFAAAYTLEQKENYLTLCFYKLPLLPKSIEPISKDQILCFEAKFKEKFSKEKRDLREKKESFKSKKIKNNISIDFEQSNAKAGRVIDCSVDFENRKIYEKFFLLQNSEAFLLPTLFSKKILNSQYFLLEKEIFGNPSGIFFSRKKEIEYTENLLNLKLELIKLEEKKEI